VGAVGGPDDVVTQFTYTSQGLVATETNPLGIVTQNEYDARGRLIKVTYAKGTPDQAVRRYEYDPAGNVTASIDENNNRTEYVYNVMNQLVRVHDALGH